jgi:hypothetical protein
LLRAVDGNLQSAATYGDLIAELGPHADVANLCFGLPGSGRAIQADCQVTGRLIVKLYQRFGTWGTAGWDVADMDLTNAQPVRNYVTKTLPRQTLYL